MADIEHIHKHTHTHKQTHYIIVLKRIFRIIILCFGIIAKESPPIKSNILSVSIRVGGSGRLVTNRPRLPFQNGSKIEYF